MKKTLLALAVAGVVAAPAAMAEVTVYGLAHVSVDRFSDTLALPGTTAIDGVEEQKLGVKSRASRVGVKAAEDLGGGVKAIAQMEWGVDMSDEKGAGNIVSRNQIVGLAGGFGTVAVGRHDTPYKMATGKLDPFADTAADYNAIIGRNKLDNRADNAIAYLSPDFNGFSIQAAAVAAENDKDATAATSVAVQYNAGPLFVSVANEDFQDARSATKVGLGYDAGVAKIGFIYETQSDVGVAFTPSSTPGLLDVSFGDGTDDYDAWLVNAVIPVGGNNAVIAEYGMGEYDKNDVEVTLMAVGVAHNFSKSTSAYVAYGNVDVDAGAGSSVDTNALTAGLVVKF